MRKTLLILSVLTFSYSNSQTLSDLNFNSLTLGNAIGQAGFQNDGGTNSNFQIIDGGAIHGNVLQITGPTTATGNYFLWNDDIANNWGTRTSGNDIIEVEFDLFTGAPTTSKNGQRLYIYNADFTQVLAGFRFLPETGVLSGVAYYNNAGTLGNYAFNLAATPVTLTANSWVRIGVSFNKTTGQVIWKGPGFNGAVTGAGVGVDPAELDFFVSAGTSNASASSVLYDNVIARATNTDTLLSVSNFNSIDNNKFIIYPNPIKDFINISNVENMNINTVSLLDINGRILKTINKNFESINVSDLQSGTYFIKIETNEGNLTKKILKS